MLLYNSAKLRSVNLKLVHLLIAASLATFILIQFRRSSQTTTSNLVVKDESQQDSLVLRNDLYVCQRGTAHPLFERIAMRSHFATWETEVWNPALNGIFKRGNHGGVGLFHAWWLSFIIHNLKPSVVIESGAFQGKGTYIIRQNAPSAQIIVVSPKTPEAYQDPASDSLYFTGGKFMDFSKIDWQKTLGNKEKIAQTLVFFDDHQAGDKRLRQAYDFGFRHFVFDDNYLPYRGDNFSPKQMCDSKKLIIWRYLQELNPSDAAKGFIYADNFSGSSKPLEKQEMDEIYQWFQTHVKRYIEAVPLYRITENRFNIPNGDYVKMCETPLFDENDPTGIRLENIYGTRESKGFTNMVYVELS